MTARVKQAMTATAGPLTGLARCLVADRLLDEAGARRAQAQATATRMSFISHLVQQRLVTAKAVASSVAKELGVPLFDLSSLDMATIPIGLVDEKLIRVNHVLPISHRGNRLFVAVSDPTHRHALDDITFHTGIVTEEILVEEDKLATCIKDYLASLAEDGTGYLGDEAADLELEAVPPDDEAEADAVYNANDTPVVRFINKMLLDAISTEASDLHFEPFEKIYLVRFRTDGVLREIARPPVNLAPRIAARLKVMARMDISERRVPQDGRIRLRLSRSKSIDFRVNTLPVLFGEKICLRILDASSTKMGIQALGYDEPQKKLFLEALNKPQGMFLVTGPTGSGKTMSLYTGLNILNTPKLNIATIEDPVEINLQGINQCPVNYKTGFGFSEALRSFLRQDPDIIMVGEIRDTETANIAVRAAQTGHMVMSTLHTNSASETLIRLKDMGVATFNLATSINLIVAQRLVRRLCDCKVKADIPRPVLIEQGFSAQETDAGLTIYAPNGCDQCVDGYKGRIGVYEVVKITPEISSIIMEDGNSLEMAAACQKLGFKNVFQSALAKVKDGITSLEEIERVISVGH